MYFTVYRTVNKLNGKVYIGKHQTNNLDDDYLGSGKMLHRAIKKHGIENFTKEILFVFDTEQEMNAKEAELVTEAFCKNNTNYNLCPGGQGGWGYINANTSKDRRSYLGEIGGFGSKNLDIEGKSKARSLAGTTTYIKHGLPEGFPLNWKGKTHKEETKLKMSISQKDKQIGNKNSQFGSMWITNGSQNTKIKKDDIIPEGWNKGRITIKG